ncbi:hypothetical protein J433_00605 [Corynebacterium glutamicum MT]|uniref:Secreted protein n=1 Tax=Corynebacterium glutamicum TaxID=1718 RepID=A0AB36I6N7_CORGT|nr:hypothetical protein [Corynebacterium glutamicum]AGN18561.1 hypothetical protein C624_04870 [Corynebacterium glutamicum SCgG1]AGN21584.1 hypothetical protein C629_04870 [Corynebacterium glutamicum SCgG2]EGV39369.1 hypothetical protein CgS9114_12921 [Corynebacterium glutamicum S9114]EOA66199.1 hypothetical protein J433_00605 [Corynebacterium glutamicum MT]EPP41311.1 hypothetical protein A583_04383 [Corynebacterium glutamicum Z188]
MNIRRSLAALAGVALLTLSGCSGEETSSNETPLTSTTTSSSTSSSATTSSSETSSLETATTEPVQETGTTSAEPAVAPAPPASPTATYMDPGAQYGEVCYSGTPDQWPNFVNPATGCGGLLNPNYVEPQPEPVFVECIYGGGSWTEQALFSDGSYGFHPDCKALRDQQIAENPYTCPQTDARVPDPSYCTPEYLNAPGPEELILQ